MYRFHLCRWRARKPIGSSLRFILYFLFTLCLTLCVRCSCKFIVCRNKLQFFYMERGVGIDFIFTMCDILGFCIGSLTRGLYFDLVWTFDFFCRCPYMVSLTRKINIWICFCYYQYHYYQSFAATITDSCWLLIAYFCHHSPSPWSMIPGDARRSSDSYDRLSNLSFLLFKNVTEFSGFDFEFLEPSRPVAFSHR